MKAVVVGYGAMGKLLSQMLGDELASVVAIECENKKIDDVKENFDVIIDFSNPANLDMICEYVSKTKKPVVFATTGYTEEQLKKIDDLSKVAPVLRSANFSLGVIFLLLGVKTVLMICANRFYPFIIKKCHSLFFDYLYFCSVDKFRN